MFVYESFDLLGQMPKELRPAAESFDGNYGAPWFVLHWDAPANDVFGDRGYRRSLGGEKEW